MQQLPDVEQQFGHLGLVKTVSQSQEIKEEKHEEDPKGDEPETGDGDKDVVYSILFRQSNTDIEEERYFDAEGFKILEMMSKHLEI